ncbi:autotransporter-associated beta strand repeat-containing protein [Gemmata sp.]|uniref:autotransporter-associated beta strand repeat-containing protein n=1 Tax=Gemmata sp. TaxID=1914242 RepID=UPI003F6F4DAB
MTSAKYGGGIVIGGDVQFGSKTAPASSTAALSFANAVSLGNTTRTLTIGNDGTTTFSGVISNTSGGLTIAAIPGAMGQIRLSGANTYSGATTINSGTLALIDNGSINNSPTIIVGSGATLNVAGTNGGNYTFGGATTQTLHGGGTLIGAATIGSNGTVEGGSSTLSPGLNVATSLAFGSGSTYSVKLFGTSLYDISLLSADPGAITIDATPNTGARLRLDLSALSAEDVATLRSLGANNYTVIRVANGGSTQNFHESNFSISDLGHFDSSEWTLVTNPSSGVQLLFTPVPVPEPAAVLGVAVAALGFGGFVRRRFRKPSEPASAA